MQEVVIEENVMETWVQENLMVKKSIIGVNKCMGKLENFPSFDQ